MASAPKAWRQWMRLDIEAVLNSEDIFHMTPQEFMGYMFLIFHQWKSETGYLPQNDEFLRKRSRLTKNDWEAARGAILEKFDVTAEGYSNPRCRAELDRVMAKHGKLVENVAQTNRKREERKTLSVRRVNAPRTLGHAPYSYSLSSVSSLPSTTPSTEVPGLEPEKTERLRGDRPGQSQEQFSSKGENDLENSFDESPKDDIHLRLREEQLLDRGLAGSLNDSPNTGETGDAALPAEDQQAVLEAATQGKSFRVEPAKVISDGWPEDRDKAEDLKLLLAEHIKPAAGHAAMYAVTVALEALVEANGGTEWQAYLYLARRFSAYRAVVEKWPLGKRQFAVKAENFLNEGIYTWGEELWGNGGDDNDSERGGQAILQRAREARGDQGGGGGFVPVLGAEELRARQRAFREATWGAGFGNARPRAF